MNDRGVGDHRRPGHGVVAPPPDGPPTSARHRAPRLRPVLRIQEDDATRKELEASRDSAQKAVEQARDTQQKLSWEENARKAEEARKRRAAERDWTPLLVGGLAVGLLAILVRSWLRRRG